MQEAKDIVWEFWAEHYQITPIELQSWKDDPDRPMHCASCGWHGPARDISNNTCPQCHTYGNFEPCINGRCMFGWR